MFKNKSLGNSINHITVRIWGRKHGDCLHGVSDADMAAVAKALPKNSHRGTGPRKISHGSTEALGKKKKIFHERHEPSRTKEKREPRSFAVLTDSLEFYTE